MGLLESIANLGHSPSLEVYIGGRKVEALSCTVDHGYDVASAAGTILLASVPSWLQFRQEVEIRIGWDGYTVAAFSGYVEDDGRSYFPFENDIKAAGWLKLSQFPYPSEVTYTSQTDTYIVDDLLSKVGVNLRDIAGEGTTNLGTIEAVTLRAGGAPFDIINELDELWGYRTYDTPWGVHRRLTSKIPSNTPAFALTQGTNIIKISRPRTVRGIRNKVVVTGHPDASPTATATWVSPNPLVPNPPQYIAYEVRSDLIESAAVAANVAERVMGLVNRVVEEVEVEVPGNPYLTAGTTVTLEAAQVGISTPTPYWIKHVRHIINDSGFITRVTCEGGEGESGYQDNLAPQAVFSHRVSSETWGGTTYFTFNGDASPSWDPDDSPGSLAYAWSNNMNDDTGGAVYYATKFTAAQFHTGTVAVTLEVTDPGALTDDVGATLDRDYTTITARELYVAAGAWAEASPDGGSVWYTWTPDSGTVISTPEIAAEDFSLFGLDDGRLWKTEDHLASGTAELLHTFGDDVNCIWINETDSNRITVGLDNGKVERSLDGGSVWTELKDYDDPVYWIVESALNPGQYRVATGESIRITYDDFTNDAALITWTGGTAQKSSLSFFGNYGCASAGGSAVKDEDGTAITGIENDVRALTHHIRDDILWATALDDDGTTMNTYVKEADEGTFTAKATQADAGQPNHMVRDGDSWMDLYIACEDGLYKSYDALTSIVQLRDYSAGTLCGYQVGYGSAPMLANAGTTIYTDDEWLFDSLWNGSSNDDPAAQWYAGTFDDSAWGSATEQGDSAEVAGAKEIWGGSVASTTEQVLSRREFTLGRGAVSSATLTITADDEIVGVWVNGINVGSKTTAKGTVKTITIDPNYLLPNAANVIAVRAKNTS